MICLYGNTQSIELRLKSEDSIEQKIIDTNYQPEKFKNLKNLKSKLDSLSIVFQKMGYIDFEFSPHKRINDSIIETKIYLKQKYHTIYIYDSEKFFSKTTIEKISDSIFDQYFTIKIDDLESALELLNEKLINKGLPFSSVSLKNIKKNKNLTLSAELEIEKNKPRTIDKIIVTGYEKFPKSYIKHYLKLKRETDFNLDDIQFKTKNINTLNFSSEVKPPEIQFTKDSTSIYLYVKKNKSNFFDGFLGFGTNEDTGKIEFNGYLDLNLNNNLNYGESLNITYKSDASEQRNFNANIVLPYIFGTPIGSEFSLRLFKKDSSFTTTQQEANIFYNINPKNKIAVGLNSIQSNSLSNSLINSSADFSSRLINSRYEHISKSGNQLLFPIDFYFLLNLGFGTREHDSTKQNQSHLTLETYKIFNLNRNNSIFLKVIGQGIVSDSYFENELYRFGGINSIRGFEEQSLLATKYGVLNSEYRYRLSPSIYIHSIIDAGYLENEITSNKEKILGFGFGFGLLSQSGLIKFNYANGKSENQSFKFSKSKVHISFIANF